MGDQFASVRLLYTVPDLFNLPSLDVQILVDSVADDPVARAVQHLGQGVKLALLFRGNTDGKNTLCHAVLLRGAGVIICNLPCLEGVCKGINEMDPQRTARRTSPMKQELSTVAIDLAKKIFHLVGADSTGQILWRKRLTRN